ncbi:MAG: hypothetical protein ACK4TP_03085 [Hyphomicrobium sp.]|jgi:hypothetical protein
MTSSILRTVDMAFLVVCAAVAGTPTLAEVRLAPARHPGGIWKAAVPPAGMRAEFDGYDPIGLASGAMIRADCSLNWVDPDSGKLYCFSSATSQSYFQDWPKKNVERAARTWRLRANGGS